MFHRHRILERTLATASFCVAVALAFVSLSISKDHDIMSGALMTIAQFLTFSATLLGIDYKFSHYAQKFPQATPRNQEQ